MREGSKGWCKNCGFEIAVENVRTGRVASGPFWRLAWVHTRGADRGHERCMWHAEPKSHSKPERTLYQQISDLRAQIRVLSTDKAGAGE